MIKSIFYTDNITYIKDTEDKEITTQNLSFAQAFHFARINNVEFDYDRCKINKDDEESFSHYLQYQVGGCENTNISHFFNLLEQNGIRKIINNNVNLFGRKGVRATISKIVDDYNSEVALYNIECYGTDTYIAQVLYEHLMTYNSTLPKKDSRVYTLFKLVDCDDYNLDVFLDILKQFTDEDEDTKLLKQLKADFNREWDYTTEALDSYIGYCSTYGGDYTGAIAKAMNECFDALIEGKSFCDRKGLINRLTK